MAHGKLLAATVLLALAVVQIAVISAYRDGPSEEYDPTGLRFVSVGDTVEATIGSDGEPMADGSAARRNALDLGTVVFAFGVQCTHSRAVADSWREWLAKDHPVRAVAVTRDEHATARSYAEHERWQVDVVSFEGARSGTWQAAVTNLTPAVYLLDVDGVVRYHGHGGNLSSLDEAITALAGSHARAP